MSPPKGLPKGNLFLASLEPAELRLLEPHLRDVTLTAGAVLCHAGAPIEAVYFPTEGMVSILTPMNGGQAVESMVIGREGMVGSAVIGTRRAFDFATMQIVGAARRLPAPAFLAAYEQSRRLRSQVNRYNTMLWAQAQQCACCNALHAVESRLCNWLLQARDRTGSDSLALTQEILSQMLGVQRTSVTLVAGRLKDRRLIRVGRGRVHILDPAGLGERACECYATTKDRIEQVLRPLPPA